MKKIDNIKIIFCFFSVLLISLIGIFTITNNNDYSLIEGRNLTKFPHPDIKDFLHDEIYTTYTNAFSDQMIAKKIFVKLYQYLNPQRYVGDIVKGKNNQLFYQPLIVENENEYISSLKDVIKNNMNIVAEEVSKNGGEFIFVSIPRKDVVMNKYLPFSYIDGTENYLKYIDIINSVKSDNVKLIDAYNLFYNEDVYYQTDHHLNIRGAYYIFNEIINQVNKKHNIKIDSLEKEYFIEKKIVNGAYNRKLADFIKPNLEELTLIPIDKNIRYKRYDSGKLSNVKVFGKDNTYASAYMGADYAETIIDTNLDNFPNILYVGTSFTNVLESLSVYKFNKMVSIDYRHNNTGKSIVDYVKEHDIDYVIFICSQSDNPLKISSIKQQLGY